MNGTLMRDQQLDEPARSGSKSVGGRANPSGAAGSMARPEGGLPGDGFLPRTAAGRRALHRRARRRATGPAGAAVTVAPRRGTRVSAEPEPVSALREAVLGRWARLATTITVVGVLVVVGVTLMHPGPRITLVPVRIQPGDSLVTLARTAQPDADPGQVAEQIRQANALSGSDIRPGTVLLIPSEQH